ncbi:LysR family transcriptional regulator, partial [Lactobacillus sp. XV13L]|nr:LysR family transcriptional regulator [Lactobacillus sp. XV13L]
MELRALNYFVAVAREGNMTRAAKKLLISQPALSRQIADLETELGTKLFSRQKRHLVLTPAGHYLLGQAQQILSLTAKAKSSLRSTTIVSGDLTIAAGESSGMQRVMNVVSSIIRDYPTVKIHLLSGDYAYAKRKLNSGLADFAVIIGDVPTSNYAALTLPEKGVWGVLMPATDPLAQKEAVTAHDLAGRTVINSQQAQ